jgi:hypothetical protein
VRIGEAIIRDATTVTKAWTKHQERVIRSYGRTPWRPPRMKKTTIKEIAWQIMPQAYAAAAGHIGMAAPRQVFYAARPLILAELRNDEKQLDSVYFTQVLLPDYIAAHPRQAASWDLLWDDRGHFREPHTNRELGLGTLNVRRYLARCGATTAAHLQIAAAAVLGSDDPCVGVAADDHPGTVAIDPIDTAYPTYGPAHRFTNVLLIEKEGFQQLFERAGIPERYDVAIMSSKGMNTTAARQLVELLPGVRFLVLHDFDKAGFSILGTLTRNTRRYHFRHRADIVDLGIRLEDVEDEELEAEPVRLHGEDPAANLMANGATPDEIDFLVEGEQRVELNAFTSDDLIDWLERKFDEHGVEKIIPDEATLIAAYRRALVVHEINRQIEQARDAAEARARKADVPARFGEQVRDRLLAEPALSWDAAVARLAEQEASR